MKLYETTLNLKNIAKGMNLSAKKAQHALKDGRVASQWVENIASQKYQFVLNSGNASEDGKISHPLFGEKTVEVRCLTENGVKFDSSKTQGVGRKGSKRSFVNALRQRDFFIVADVREMPTIKFIPVKGETILEEFKKGNIRRTGTSGKKFYECFVASETFEKF